MSQKNKVLIALLLSASLTKIVTASDDLTFEIKTDGPTAVTQYRALHGMVLDKSQKERVIESLRKKVQHQELTFHSHQNDPLLKYTKAVAGQPLDKASLKTNGTTEELIESAMLSLAAKGDLSMVRLLADFYEMKGDKHTALQFYLTEMLLTFGESYDFPALFRLTETPVSKSYLQAATKTGKTFRDALVNAGQWILAHKKDTSTSLNAPQLSLADAFELLKSGQHRAFFASTRDLEGRVSRVQFLQFFRHLGIEDVNFRKAIRCLTEPMNAKMNLAIDLKLVLNLLGNPSDETVEKLLHHLRYRAEDTHMRSIYDYIQLNRKNVSQLTDMDSVYRSLQESLKL